MRRRRLAAAIDTASGSAPSVDPRSGQAFSVVYSYFAWRTEISR